MSNRLKLRVELGDGCILVGDAVSINCKEQSPDCYAAPQMKWTLELLTDTLGKVKLNAAHIVKIGLAQTAMRQVKNVGEAVHYVIEHMRLAPDIPTKR